MPKRQTSGYSRPRQRRILRHATGRGRESQRNSQADWGGILHNPPAFDSQVAMARRAFVPAFAIFRLWLGACLLLMATGAQVLATGDPKGSNHWDGFTFLENVHRGGGAMETLVGGTLPVAGGAPVLALSRDSAMLVSSEVSSSSFGEANTEKGETHMAVYYVSTTGSNSADGSESSPFASINYALNSGLKPGDEIVVKPGTYHETVYVGINGSAAGDITIRSEIPGGAVVVPPSGGANGFTIEGNYITVDGFEVYGSDSHGIVAQHAHHITITNNVSHDNGASGIAGAWGEFYVIEGNTTYNNASSNWFSGISVYQNRNITGDTSTDGFRTIIRNNISYDNVTESGTHTDGNGIIIDDFQSTQTSGYPNYTYPTLVENNLVYGNGGKGIQITWSDYVTVRNNTAYHNNNDLLNTGTWRGEISNAQSSNNTFVNNIMVADPSVNPDNTAIDNTSYGGYTNENVIWVNNLTFNGRDGQASVRTDGGNAMPSAADGNLLGVDPGFADAPNDFRLTASSEAVDAGSDGFGLATVDLDGNDRTQGNVDLGAYEQGATPVEDSTVSGGDTSPVPVDETPVIVDTPPVSVDETSVIGETGSVTVAQQGEGKWHTVTFEETLDNPSVVLSAMTSNGPAPYTLRVRNVTDDGFEFQIDEWDYLNGKHIKETVSWMAVESGTYTLTDGSIISAGSTRADEKYTSVSFDTDAFSEAPVVLAQATNNRNKTAVNDRIDDVDLDGFKVKLKPQEADAGTDLKKEALDWIAIDKGATDFAVGTTGDTVNHKDTDVDLGTGTTPDKDFVILTDMQTHNGKNAVTVEVLGIEEGIATMRIAEETSADREIRHVPEDVGYLWGESGQIFGVELTSDDLLI